MSRLFLIVFLGLILMAGCSSETDPAYIAEIDQWHAGRIERLATEDGWLTLVGLHSLHGGVNTLGATQAVDVNLGNGAAEHVGAITIAEDQILFTAHPGVEVKLVGGDSPDPIVSSPLKSDAMGQPTILAHGPLLFHVIDRGGSRFLRVKNRESQVLQNFEGIDRFPVDHRWRIKALLEPGEATTAVPNVLGQVDQVPSPGVLVFKIRGKEFRLTAQGEPGQSIFIVFGDNTNGQASYSGGRFLSAEAPDENGFVRLDFNKAVNPPCVFSEYATCPLPSVDNLLDVEIAAGEKMWGEAH